MRRSLIASTAAATVLALSLAACSTSSTTGSGTTNKSTGTPTVALITGQLNLAYFTTMICGAQVAAKKYNVKLTSQGPATYSLPQQLQVLNAVTQTHPNGVVVAPVDPTGLNASLSSLKSSGVPVMTTDGTLSQKIDVANFRSDGVAGGVLAADVLGADLKGKGTVAVEALDPSAAFNKARATGFQQEMAKKFPGITVLPVQYDGGDNNKAAQNIEAQLAAHPDLSAVFGAQQSAGYGAASAIAAAHLTGKVKVEVFDADPTQVQGLKAGTYSVLIAQAPYYEGYDAVKVLSQILHKKIKASSVKYTNYTPLVAITKANVDSAKIKPYLYVDKCS
jgi:ribose transport system substrate-binding protein